MHNRRNYFIRRLYFSLFRLIILIGKMIRNSYVNENALDDVAIPFIAGESKDSNYNNTSLE